MLLGKAFHSEKKDRQHTAIVMAVITLLSLLGLTALDHIAVILGTEKALAFPDMQTWVLATGSSLIAIFGASAFANNDKDKDNENGNAKNVGNKGAV